MEDAQARKFDRLLVWKLDCFGRSLVDCLSNIEELGFCRIRFIKQGNQRWLLVVIGLVALAIAIWALLPRGNPALRITAPTAMSVFARIFAHYLENTLDLLRSALRV